MFEVFTTICTITGVVVWVIILLLAAAYTSGAVHIDADVEVSRDKHE